MILQDGTLLKSIQFKSETDGGCNTCEVGRFQVTKIAIVLLGDTPWAAVWEQGCRPPICYNLAQVAAVEVL